MNYLMPNLCDSVRKVLESDSSRQERVRYALGENLRRSGSVPGEIARIS